MTIRRLELIEGSSKRFWEVEVEGASVTLRWGRLGGKAQSTTKTAASPASAQAEADRLLRAKVAKGYVEQAAAGPPDEAQKPQAQKPQAQKPQAQKPQAQKPQAQKPPAPEPDDEDDDDDPLEAVDPSLRAEATALRARIDALMESLFDPANARDWNKLDALQAEKRAHDAAVLALVARSDRLAEARQRMQGLRASSDDAATDLQSFEAKHGSVQRNPALEALMDRCAGDFDGKRLPLFDGAMWTTGWRATGENPKRAEDWKALDEAMTIAKLAAAALDGETHASVTDSPYFPFVLGRRISKLDFATELKAAVGLRAPPDLPEELRVRPLDLDRENVFYDDDDLDRIFDEETSRGSRERLRTASLVLFANLSDLKEVRLPPPHVCTPVLWLGHTSAGYLAGICAVRVDT